MNEVGGKSHAELLCKITMNILDQTNLIMDLSHNQIEYLSSKQIFLWLPRFWFTNDTKINRRTRFFSHQFIGIKGNLETKRYSSICPKLHYILMKAPPQKIKKLASKC